MAAYTPSLRLTLPVTGTDDGTWGDTVNNGITLLTDASIAGTATVIQGDVANYTLTNNSGATDEARNMFLNITGALTAARNVVCPTASKLYFIKNSTTGGFAVTLKTSAGTGISVPAGSITALYCDGTNVVDAITYANIPVINATTVDTTNLEVTNIKAKDGTASITLADTTGIATFSKATVISTSDATNAALRVTQTGTGDALLVEDATNPDSTPFVVNNAGKVLIARTTASVIADAAMQINVQSASIPAMLTNTGSTSYRPHWSLAVADTEVASFGTTNTLLNTYVGGASRMTISALGSTVLYPVTGAGSGLTVSGTNLSGSTTNISVFSNTTFGSAATTRGEGFQTTLGTEAATFTLGEMGHFKAVQGTIGLNSVVTNQYGFLADSTLIGATNNYGFYSNIASTSGRFNFYANGTATNYFSGSVGIGSNAPSSKVQITVNESTAYNGAATDGQLTAGSTLFIQQTAGTNTGVAQIVFQPRTTFPYNRIVSSGGSAPFLTFVTNNAEAMRITSAQVLSTTNDALIHGLTVGMGAGALATNTAVGASALVANTTGFNNTANGAEALRFTTTGSDNAANGQAALYSNTTGSANTATGQASLYSNSTGTNNTANGVLALFNNTTTSNNTAVGYQAGYGNTTGTGLVAIGRQSLLAANTGNYHTAVGEASLYSNTLGDRNTALGNSTLFANTTGSYNVAVGFSALVANTTASNNTAVGYQAGYLSTTAADNTLIGSQAGLNITTGGRNIAVGGGNLYATTTGANNTALGWNALRFNTTASDNTAVGYQALSANTTAVRNTAVGSTALTANTTGVNTAVGYGAAATNTTGTSNSAFGYYALVLNTTGSGNTALGEQSLYNNTTANFNTAVGYQALFANTVAGYSTCIGYSAGSASNFTADAYANNTFIGALSGSTITTGRKNTILGMFNGNQGGLDIRTANNNIVLSDGDGTPRVVYLYTSATVGGMLLYSNSSADSTNATFSIRNASGPDVVFEASNAAPVGISGTMRIAKYTGNNRSINAAGTVNQNGADYAEYMVKSGDFTVLKGSLVGINADGKLTNVFGEAISFCVKSTDPGLVGGDAWFTEPRPMAADGSEFTTDTIEYAEWFTRMETARATVDRVAFCGQVPVNVIGATPGQYIVPVSDNGAIKGIAKNEDELTISDYIKAIGKVIAVEADGRAKIIVKIA